MAKPILDLNTLADRPTIGLDGQDYWLITPDIMPVLDNHRLTKAAARSDELAQKVELSKDEEAELAGLPDTLCRLVLEAPEAVLAALTDRQRMLIVATACSTFRNGLRMIAPMPAAPESSPASPTGATSSPA